LDRTALFGKDRDFLIWIIWANSGMPSEGLFYQGKGSFITILMKKERIINERNLLT